MQGIKHYLIGNVSPEKRYSVAEYKRDAKKAIKEKMPLDITSVYIKEILENLGSITGEFVTEDIINKIFEKKKT